MTWDYETIKTVAQENALSVNDLIALAGQNDPFYVGTPTETAMANWFAQVWRTFGYGNGIHLRRIHYQLVSQHPRYETHKGEPYGNT